MRHLKSIGYSNIVTVSRTDLDLCCQSQVGRFFSEKSIRQVYLAAAKVGGIHANSTYPADFIYENLQIQTNVIHAAHKYGVEKLLFFGSSCIYPKNVSQPMAEDALLTGALESTNEPYAVAKIAGIKLCESYNIQYGTDYRCVMPTNLYGPNDNFHPDNSHVLPALIRRFHEAVSCGLNEVAVWGTGNAKREFLHVDDMASASTHVMEMSKKRYSDAISAASVGHLNVGTGKDCSIRELVDIVAHATGFDGNIVYDTTKPDGTKRKLLDTTRLSTLGWSPSIELRSGICDVYKWYCENVSEVRI